MRLMYIYLWSVYNTHWLIIDIHESFLSLAILIIAQFSADNTVMDHAKEKNIETY